MSQSLAERLDYHGLSGEGGGQDRKCQRRLDLIKSNFNFENEVVLDIGCSGGFFTFALAQSAKRVIAIDGDMEVIQRNKQFQKSKGIENVEFIHSEITTDIIYEVGEVDITLFCLCITIC